jgi:hypothetical protein
MSERRLGCDRSRLRAIMEPVAAGFGRGTAPMSERRGKLTELMEIVNGHRVAGFRRDG